MEHETSPAQGPQSLPSARGAQSLEIVVLEDGLQDVTIAEGSDAFGALAWTIADPLVADAPFTPLPAAAPASPPDLARELARKDATIRELESVLAALRPLAEDAGRSELARLAAEQRSSMSERELGELRQRLTLSEATLAQSLTAAEDLRATCEERAGLLASLREELDNQRTELAGQREELATWQERVRGLEQRQSEREGVLKRERERHAATRAKLAERTKVASERWAEIRRLKADTDD